MTPRWPAWITLTAAALPGLAVALFVPQQAPMPVYFIYAARWASTGRLADTFIPQGYMLFAGLALKLAGPHGILAAQLLLHVAMTFIAILLLRELHLPASWSALGAMTIALNPVLLLSIGKVWDVQFSAFLFLLLALLCLRLAHASGKTLQWTAALAGAALAAGVFCRPNYLLLLPAIGVALAIRRSPIGRSSILFGPTLAAAGITLVSTAITYTLLGVASHGSPFFPQNGSYNLYAGHNSKTIDALLTDLNAEPSLVAQIHAAFPSEPAVDFIGPAMREFYGRQAMDYIRHHPAAEAELVPVKLFTFFRPDTKNSRLGSLAGIGQALMCLPALLFAVSLLLPGRPALGPGDRLLLFLEIAYVVPFLITNSDPRFRVPLDSLLLLHVVSLLYRRMSRDRSPASTSSP